MSVRCYSQHYLRAELSMIEKLFAVSVEQCNVIKCAVQGKCLITEKYGG